MAMSAFLVTGMIGCGNAETVTPEATEETAEVQEETIVPETPAPVIETEDIVPERPVDSGNFPEFPKFPDLPVFNKPEE